ncbi:MAG: DUF134 domain-containing protein [Bacillota bacterium]
MPRPRKRRRVCALPDVTRFGPLGRPKNDCDIIVMSIDEYECIRLIDHQNMTQAECAEAMNVARTTVQGMYDAARKKLAKVLTEASILVIEGGDYEISASHCDNRHHRRQHQHCEE